MKVSVSPTVRRDRGVFRGVSQQIVWARGCIRANIVSKTRYWWLHVTISWWCQTLQPFSAGSLSRIRKVEQFWWLLADRQHDCFVVNSPFVTHHQQVHVYKSIGCSVLMIVQIHNLTISWWCCPLQPSVSRHMSTDPWDILSCCLLEQTAWQWK